MSECATCPAIPRIGRKRDEKGDWHQETTWEPVLLDLDHHGHPIPHRCCVCADAGRVRMVEDRHDPSFGKAFPCPRCRVMR